MNAVVSVGGRRGFNGTVAADAGDLKLRAYVSSGPTIGASDVTLSVEKPGSFLIDFDVPQKDVRFQFMNTATVLEKQFNMTYSHMKRENRTILDGTLLLNPDNKVSANYTLGSRNCKLRYSYVHRGLATFEPCYDFGKDSWELALSKAVPNGDVIRASYETSTKVFGLEWLWKSLLDHGGQCKVSASFSLADGFYIPKLNIESSWNFQV